MAAHQARDPARAAPLFAQVLEADPSCLDALYLLGTLHAESGKLTEAESLLLQALKIQPKSPYILTNLANVFLMQDKIDQAAPALARALALKLDLVEAEINLGILLRRLGRLAESEQHLRSALGKRREWPQIAVNLALTLADLERREDAIAELEAVLGRHPDYAPAHEMLGLQHGHLGHEAAAVTHLRRFIELARPESDTSEAWLMLAKLSQEPAPQRYPVSPLLRNYERKAASWDTDVGRAGNEFLGPRHVGEWVGSCAAAPGTLSIVDLGCGTGLCGPLLKPLASRLAGVDLSQPMLDQALGKHCYDELCCSDLIGFLQGRPAAFDLAVASGVFILFGDLAPLFGCLHAALRDGGQVLFTAYRAERGDVEVRHNLHFAHRPEYLRRVAADSGFEIDSLTDCVHEFEHGVAQPGLLVVMRRNY